MTPLEGLAITGAACAAAALATRGPAPWRWTVFALFLVAFALPFQIDPDQRFARAAAGLWIFGAAMRLYVLAREASPRSAWRRVLSTTFVYDVRFVRRTRPRVEWSRGAGVTVAAAIAVGAWWLMGQLVDEPPTAATLAGRWGILLVAFYASMSAVDGLLVASLALVGLEVTPTLDHPILSRSIGELWFRRWNREVGRWLDAQLFRPLARRRRARLGLLAAFAFSALLHVYPVAAGADLVAAALAGAFFLSHGAIAALERRLRVSRWTPLAARAWTIAWVLSTWPLFAEPMLAVVYGPEATVLVGS